MTDYFAEIDELNFLESQKDSMKECYSVARSEIQEWFRMFASGTINRTEFLNRIKKSLFDIGIAAGLSFLDGTEEIKNDSFENEIRENEIKIAENIVQTTLEKIDTEYFLSQQRADTIAFNESVRLFNASNHYMAKKMGYAFHRWVSTMDKYTRPSHYAANGQFKPIDVPFEINGCMMLYPGDITYGAPIEETAGCRCVETFFTKRTHVV